MTDEPITPPHDRPRTWAASREKTRNAQRRQADKLEKAGWTCTPPEGFPRHSPVQD